VRLVGQIFGKAAGRRRFAGEPLKVKILQLRQFLKAIFRRGAKRSGGSLFCGGFIAGSP
jgi:hypothetical protein